MEEKGGRWENREKGMKEVGTRIENKSDGRERGRFSSVVVFWV